MVTKFVNHHSICFNLCTDLDMGMRYSYWGRGEGESVVLGSNGVGLHRLGREVSRVSATRVGLRVIGCRRRMQTGLFSWFFYHLFWLDFEEFNFRLFDLFDWLFDLSGLWIRSLKNWRYCWIVGFLCTPVWFHFAHSIVLYVTYIQRTSQMKWDGGNRK